MYYKGHDYAMPSPSPPSSYFSGDVFYRYVIAENRITCTINSSNKIGGYLKFIRKLSEDVNILQTNSFVKKFNHADLYFRPCVISADFATISKVAMIIEDSSRSVG